MNFKLSDDLSVNLPALVIRMNGWLLACVIALAVGCVLLTVGLCQASAVADASEDQLLAKRKRAGEKDAA